MDKVEVPYYQDTNTKERNRVKIKNVRIKQIMWVRLTVFGKDFLPTHISLLSCLVS